MGSNGNLGKHMLRCLALSVLVTCAYADAWGDDVAERAANADRPAFYLEDGDRVVLLGGTIIEREQVYGEWELMLTCLYADADFTVRNLGWSGDTVWAESRGVFDPPEVGYQRMIDQIRDLNPTVVILGYGHNEAWAGEAGLDAFITQYEKLIDDIQAATEAETRYLILLPHPHFPVGGELPDPATYNDLLPAYVDAIRRIGDSRQIPAVSAFGPEEVAHFEEHPEYLTFITDDGVQLTNRGYTASARLQLELEPVFASLSVKQHSFSEVYFGEGQFEIIGYDYDIRRNEPDTGEITVECRRSQLIHGTSGVRFHNLPEGSFTLRIDGNEIVTMTSQEWDGPLFLRNDPDSLQREQLRQAIIRKNELYFHRWRPQNVTYLFGFRAHEQGNNAGEIPQFDPLIEEQEALIRELKHPVEHVWELAPAE